MAKSKAGGAGKPNPASTSFEHKQKRIAKEQAEVELENEDDIDELKRLVEEARSNRPKDVKKKQKKLKKQQQFAKEGGEDENDDEDENGANGHFDDDEEEEEDAELSDEERVLRELKAERARGENENGDDEDDEEDDENVDHEDQQRLVNDAAALREVAEELRLKSFAESLVVSDDVVFTEKINPEDDKLREARFVDIATRAVESGRKQLDELKIPHRRPTDFMAEMIKSDDHMARVKRRLLFEQQKMKTVEARKAAQRNKKRSKEVKKHRDEERSARKRQAAELATSFRDKDVGDDDKKNKRMRTGSKPSKKGGAKQRPGKAKRKSVKGKRK